MSSQTYLLCSILILLAIQTNANFCFDSVSECSQLCNDCQAYSNSDFEIHCCKSETFPLKAFPQINSTQICYNNILDCQGFHRECLAFHKEDKSGIIYCDKNSQQSFKEDVENFLEKFKTNVNNVESHDRMLFSYPGYDGYGYAGMAAKSSNGNLACSGQCYSNSQICTEACSSCNPCQGNFCCVM